MAGRAPGRAVVARSVGRTFIFALNLAADDEAEDIRGDVTRARELQAEDHRENPREGKHAYPNGDATLTRAANTEHDGARLGRAPIARNRGSNGAMVDFRRAAGLSSE